MFDIRVRRLVDPVLERMADLAVRNRISADTLTTAGCIAGLSAAGCIATGAVLTGLTLFLVGRCLDGLDGTVARRTGPTNRGGFLDIVLDFLVYATIPLGFAILDPAANALAACTLLASFLANGTAFLAFALMQERGGSSALPRGGKAFHYLAGLAEGTETIAAFSLFCLWPSAFAPLAYAFAALCAISAAARIVLAWRMLGA